MKGEGELGVRAEQLTLAEPLTLATRTLQAGSYVRLTVRDSGSGMAPELLERIFDPFFTTKEVGVGTGLGLSLVHRIVTDLAGGIAVQSEPDHGSTFTVWLPSQPYVGAPAVAGAETPAARGEGEVVLLVDDEESLVRLGEEMLAELGYEPVGFNSSTEALEALRADPARFDLMLSDEAMPGMSGSELAAEARRLKPRMPIVLMTGFATPALVQRSRELGVAEVLTKPLAARDIARCLAAALH
jgi:CheY-like chemotaxis protein